MRNEFKSKVNFIKEQIEKDFKTLNIEEFFEKFKEDERTLDFLKYYNKTVLDKEKIDFNEFRRLWALHFTKKLCLYFDENYKKLINEIKNKREIKDFFGKYCHEKVKKKNSQELVKKFQGSFCSKLFHTIIPDEFPPVDRAIKKKFGLQKEEYIKSILIIRQGYKLFVKENQGQMKLIRKLLSKPKFTYLRINELSDIRILDMYYWFKLNREKI